MKQIPSISSIRLPIFECTLPTMSRLLLLLLVSFTYGKSIDERIFGGEEAKISDFKYQVSIRILGRHTCSGALISPNKIVTAGRCVDGLENDLPDLSVLAGTKTLGDVDEGQERRVSSLTLHPKYKAAATYYEYDVAIVEVEEDFDHKDAVPIPLMRENMAIKEIYFTGWGQLRLKDEDFSEMLQKSKMTTVTQTDCDKYHKKHPKYMTCYKGTKGVKGVVCPGDEGNPVIIFYSGSKYLAAIAGSADYCEKTGHDLFTKMDKEIIPFIMEHLE